VLSELNKRIGMKKSELAKNDEINVKITDEISDLGKRVKAIEKTTTPNGMLFCISESLDDDKSEYIFEEEVVDSIRNKVKTIPNVNVDAFMNLFKSAKYIISIGNEFGDFINVTETKPILPKSTHYDDDGKFVYRGDKKWHDLVEEMYDLGYTQDVNFSKKAGSNSYEFTDTLNPELINHTSDTTIEAIILDKTPKTLFMSIVDKIKSLF
jgi:hypothetical protein